MSAPVVTVVVSTYAGEALIGGCLEMLLGQTIADRLHIVVVDSGSPQREEQVVRRFQRHHPNLQYVRTERETLYRAWNRGLDAAQGRYFANVNTDDWIRDDALELMAAALDEHPECDLAYAHWAATDAPRRPPTADDPVCWHAPYEPAMPLVFCFGGCVQCWRTSSLRTLGGFDPAFVACGDLDVLCRLSAAGGNAVLVPEVLEGFFQNPDGISHRNQVALDEQRAIWFAARRDVDIRRLYACSDDEPATVADAWTALGTLAMTAQVPWHTGPIADHHWALQCYDRALAVDPGHVAALHGRHVVLRSIGSADEADRLLDGLPAALQAQARSWNLGLPVPAIRPAVSGPVFQPGRAAQVARDSSRSQPVP